MQPTWTSDCGTVKLWLADSMFILPSVAFDVVIADPPYGIDYQSARRTDRAEWKPKIANDERPFVWWLPYTAKASCVLCFCRWDVQEAFRLAMDWAGLNVKSQIIWDRESHGMGDLSGSPAPQHDVIWFAASKEFVFHGSRPKSVVRSMRLSGENLTHPNEKPVDLYRQLIVDYASDGQIVCDPFLGSGASGQAAVIEGRKFLGIEKEPKYFEIAKRRIQDELTRKTGEYHKQPEKYPLLARVQK